MTSVSADVIGAGEGFVGEIARLRLELDPPEPGAPRSLIAKLPTRNRSNRALAQLGAAYEREVRFYQELADEVPLRTPRVYHADCDPTPGARYGERIARGVDALPGWLLWPLVLLAVWLGRVARPQRAVLLLEDLAPARVGDQLSGCSLPQARSVLRSLAATHARYWNSPRLAELWWVGALDLLARSLRLLFRRARRLSGARFEAFGGRLDWLDAHGVALVRALMRSPQTLLHGDFRLDNLFVPDGPADGAVTAIDWQVVGRGPGVYDVAYFLSGTLDPETPHQQELELLRAYHDELVAHGVRDYDFETCLLDYRRCLLVLVQRLVAGADTLEFEHARGQELMDTWLERLAARLRDLDPESVFGSA
ncbi:MAG: phosphotransferase [Myxococcota bacterium]